MVLFKARLHIIAGIWFALLTRVISYTWPSPQYDALEEFLYEGVDKSGASIANLASGCSSRLFAGGPTVNAEWLRLAYHDMATHNVTDGTGGLDSSILYELGRAENVGAGNIDTLRDFQAGFNKYVTRADLIAMGAVWGVAGCSGPPIRYRGGRVDASSAGRPGVPEPHQDLQSHINSFKLQGFNESEMIGLVACGHTLGAVCAVDFPTIVAEQNGSNPIVEFFDTTLQYDNAVVVEYLGGTTKNPLVVNANATIRSDLRIFSSDGNATMNSIASPVAFADTCQSLIERMIDTVPADVQLTDDIALLPFKVKTAELIVTGADLVFHVIARIAIPGPSNSTPIPSVSLFWCDRAGPSADCADGTVNFANVTGNLLPGQISPLTRALNMSLQSYSFRVAVAPGKSVGKFWFGVLDTGNSAEDTVLEGNGGRGYLLNQDMVISVPDLSSVNLTDSIDTPPEKIYQMVVGVKSNSTPTVAEMHVYDNTFNTGVGPGISIPPPLNTTVSLQLLTSRPPVAGYTLYFGNFTNDQRSGPSFDFAIETDGKHYELDFIQGPALIPIGNGDGGEISGVGTTSLTAALFGGQLDTTSDDD